MWKSIIWKSYLFLVLKKEVVVFKDISFVVFLWELGVLDKYSGLMFGMYFNVLNIIIVNIVNVVLDDGYSDVSDRIRIDII